MFRGTADAKASLRDGTAALQYTGIGVGILNANVNIDLGTVDGANIIEVSSATGQLVLNSSKILTGGSASIRGFYMPLRQAGATAREMLVAAAAAQDTVNAVLVKVNQAGTVTEAVKKLG